MKKILSIIIITLSIFSTLNFANAKQNGILEENLNLTFGPEEFEFDLPKVGFYYFKNNKNKIKLNNFRSLDKILRETIITKYRNGEIDFNKINGIIDNYSLFIYHINRYFYYLSIKERNPNLKESNTAIFRNFNLSRSYLKKVKYIISLTNKK